MENTAQYYYEQLSDTITPGKVLASFYCKMYRIEVTKSEIMMMNKAVELFGRFIVYFAVSDMIRSYPRKLDDAAAMLYKICSSRFERMHHNSSVQAYEPLTKNIEKLRKDIEALSKEKLKIPSSKGL